MSCIKENMDRLGHAKDVEYFETSFLDWEPEAKLDKVSGCPLLGSWCSKATPRRQMA